MAQEESKSNTELLRELQDVADEYTRLKEEVFTILDVMDKLEIKYYRLKEEANNKRQNG